MTPESIIELGLADFAIAFGMIATAIVLSRLMSVGIETALMTGAIRSAAQLMAIGYILQAVFDIALPWVIVAMLGAMTIIAAWTAGARQRLPSGSGPDDRMRIKIGLAVAIGAASLSTIAYVIVLVVHPHPLWNPRYIIPLAGMMISYAMNSSALAFERFVGDLGANRSRVESYLSLGATPAEATWDLRRGALKAAAIPLLNHLATVGIVQLPGMMTGQILSGESPVTAVGYQIVVSYMLAPTMMIGSAIAARFARDLAFDERGRLR